MQFLGHQLLQQMRKVMMDQFLKSLAIKAEAMIHVSVLIANKSATIGQKASMIETSCFRIAVTSFS
jgi:hypothetical protein